MRRRCSFWMPDHDHHLSLPTLRHSNISQTTNIGIHTHILILERNSFGVDILHLPRYVDTFIVYSNSKRRPQWNIQSCQQRDMENKYLESDTIEHFDVLQLSAKWSLIMHFTEYRCWSPHYLLLTCRRLIFRPSISQDKSNQNIFIFWFPIRVQIANSWLAAPDSDGRGPGTANDAWKVPAEAGIGSLTISSAFWVSVHLSARIFALVFLRHYSGSSQCPGAGCLFRLRLDISRQCVLHVADVTADN